MEKKKVTLREYIEHYGYTIKEFDDCVDTLCKKGVANGAYQDYNLLQLVIGWLCNYDSVIGEENDREKRTERTD